MVLMHMLEDDLYYRRFLMIKGKFNIWTEQIFKADHALY